MSRRPRTSALAASAAALVAAALAAPARAQSGDPASELLAGVSDLAAPGSPGPLCAWSKDAVVVLAGSAGRELRAPAVVAGRAGKGRFVALPHAGLFAAGVLGKGETGRFLVNAARWAAGPGKEKPRVAARGEELAALLRESGLETSLLGAAPLAEELSNADVLCGLTSEVAPADVEPLIRFLEGGGGVIAGQSALSWQAGAGGAPLDANPLNRLFARYGVAWAGGYLGRVGEVGFSTERSPPRLVHGDAAITYLFNHRDPAKVENARPMLQAAATVLALVSVLPLEDAIARPRLEQALADLGPTLNPSPAEPIPALDGLRRSLLALALATAEKKRPEHVGALPCAKLFPGEVPPAAPRVARSVEIDTATPRWHSTGLYAAPGEVVTVNLPEGRGAEAAGLALQIGAHADELFEAAEWRRAPKLARRFPLDRASVAAASPFGGLLYVDVPDGCALGRIELGFERVIDAPRFVLERTSNEEWRTRQRHRLAPWAELESSKVVLTVPSERVRGLADPESLLRRWDRAADAAADFVALPRARRFAERFVADAQPAAGAMHAGYPIVVQLDAAAVLADPEKLALGDLALFSELGRNHQDQDWTFEGTADVTNRLIGLYVLETACGRTPAAGDSSFDEILEGAGRIRAHLEGGADFEGWKKDPLLALQTYLQVKQAFGWDAFRKVFSEYRGLPRRDKPKSHDARRDLWLVMLSRACGRNLGAFFSAWGVPTSEAARGSLLDLPAWMPEGFPPQ
jgi:hypothetical protein